MVNCIQNLFGTSLEDFKFETEISLKLFNGLFLVHCCLARVHLVWLVDRIIHPPIIHWKLKLFTVFCSYMIKYCFLLAYLILKGSIIINILFCEFIAGFKQVESMKAWKQETCKWESVIKQYKHWYISFWLCPRAFGIDDSHASC